jgi:hypothetical protein
LCGKPIKPLLPKRKDYGKYVPLDMSRQNFKRKLNDNVIHFTSYEIELYGKTFVLKCKAIKDISISSGYVVEHPYSLKEKR